MSDLIGQIIGNYRIEAQLGQGGMGQVFRARHIHLERLAAIKVIHASLAIDSDFRVRFQQEARAAASLNHPHIIVVYDFGEQDGRAFLAMELSTIGSLRDWLQQQGRSETWTLANGLELVRQAADGLAYAHNQGMIHRDIKPDNFMLTGGNDGAPLILKITDFGLVRLAEGNNLTGAGTAMGTPAYMSPEQCQGMDLDGRSDLYSLGVVLYEVVTGYLPFSIKSINDAVYKHVYTIPTPPRQIRPDLPPSLEAIILRCLAKRPDERFATAADLADALRQVLTEHGPALHGQINPPLPVQPISQPAATVVATPVTAAEPVPSVATLAQPTSIPLVRVLNAKGQTIQVQGLTGDGLTIGRSPSNDLVLNSQTISRHHLEINWDGNKVTITDLGSEQGTRLEGAPLLPQVPQTWQWRTSLQVGEYWLRLEPPRALVSPASIAPPSRGEAGSLITDFVSREPVSISRSPIGVSRIDVALEDDALTLIPGQPTILRMLLTNRDPAVDHFTIGLIGVPKTWTVSNSMPEYQLLPGRATTAAITITIPRTPESRAGIYPVTIQARSRSHPAEAGTASAQWTVQPFEARKLELQPKRVRARHTANYMLTLSNLGNAPEHYTLSCEDDELILSYDFIPEHSLEPGGVARIRLAVKRSPQWFGTAQQYVFRVHARVAGTEKVSTAGARFQQEALVPQWAAWFALVLGILVFLTVIPTLARPIDGASSQIATWLAQRWLWLAVVGLCAVVLLKREYLLAELRQLKNSGKRRRSSASSPQLDSSANDMFQSRAPVVHLSNVPTEMPGNAAIGDQAAEPVQGNATMILKRRSILRRSNDQILEELVLHQSYEQLWNAFAYAEGERILLTGYGPFGATSLVNCAIAKARQEIKRNGHGEGALLVFHFQLTREDKDEFAVEANHFSLGRLRAKDELRNADEMEVLHKYAQEKSDPSSSLLQRMDFALDKPIKKAFFENSRWNSLFLRRTPEVYDLQKFVDDIHNFMEKHQDNTELLQIVSRLAGSEEIPSRIVMIFDKIRYMETLEAISNSDLFSNKHILALVVARREDFDQWQQPDTFLSDTGFKEWYIPCIWNSNLDKILFESDVAGGQEFDQQRIIFRKHLEYVGRGSLGNIIDEIRQSKNISHGLDVSFINVGNMQYRDDILHNAWMQDVLDLNWGIILGDLFAGKYRDSEDRARIGVYYVVDWIAKKRRFSIDQLMQESHGPISISPEHDLVNLTIQNILYVLVDNRYLKEQKDHYQMIWKRAKPPVPHKVRLKQRQQGAYSAEDTAYGTSHLDSSPQYTSVDSKTSTVSSDDTADPNTSSEESPQAEVKLKDASHKVVDEDRRHLLELRKSHKQRLQMLELRTARSGADIDPKVLMEIEDIRKEIQRLTTMLGEDLDVAE